MTRHINTVEKQGVGSFVFVFKPLLVSLSVTFIFLCLLALCLAYGPVSEQAVDGCILFITLFSMFLSGLLSARQKASRGFLNGGVAGIAYVFSAYVTAALAFGSFSPGLSFLKLLLLGTLMGAFGGIVGVNTRKKKR